MIIYSIIPKQEKLSLNKFLDYDKSADQFYDNIYLKGQNLVIKIPLNVNKEKDMDIIIESFDLTKYTYLLSY
ncbi:MAG: hypothetical protein ACFE78_09255 [Candidatus Hodarchaeota archaeon]